MMPKAGARARLRRMQREQIAADHAKVRFLSNFLYNAPQLKIEKFIT